MQDPGIHPAPRPGTPATAEPGHSNREGTRDLNAGWSGIDGDGVRAVLVQAATGGLVVVLALVDGTRLNGTPLPLAPPPPDHGGHHGRAGQPGTFRLQEETGQEPFVVRLEHITYVRILSRRR